MAARLACVPLRPQLSPPARSGGWSLGGFRYGGGKTTINKATGAAPRRRGGRPSVPRAAHAEMTGRPAFLEAGPYEPPSWAAYLRVPPERYSLACLPTPVHRWHLPGVPEGVEVFIKRDDLTGMQLSGNKVRKLEFLMAEAKAGGHDCVITIGGIQSNHCRATAVAARYLGLDCHLILRNSRAAVDEDPRLVGNLLVERLVGCHIHQVTKEEYTTVGSEALGRQLKAELEAQGKRPYVIPVGGSNSLGCWGYLEAVAEMQAQCPDITDIAMACGSGGTTAGLALGVKMSGWNARVHGYGVCDSPKYFYEYIDGLLSGLGATPEAVGASAAELVRMVNARGAGYAISTEEELQVMKQVAMETGVVLDPVYSGKAVASMLDEMRAEPDAWAGRKVLFVHTGGLLGMYEKADQMQPLVEALDRHDRMQVSME
mmetsp:Transcript_38187/g.97635  ORF Transcript_38187/g.97635 Transcript_38187/m.97635 type:complete len:429 (-) Transcript_38187:175-1461(-)|eukprot:jgi/Tetstr1/465669/TSEL_010313.t1